MHCLTVRSLVISLAVVWCGACSQRGKPSPAYGQANDLFTRTYAEKLDDAFDDPRMDKVVELLAEVPPKSSDAPAAQALLLRITAGRAQARADAQKRAQSLAAARTPVVLPPSTFSRSSETGADAGQTAPAVDAGPPRNPTPGMLYSDFVDRFSGCFRQGNSILVEGRGMRETWELKDITNCRDRHPGFEDMIVLIDEGQVLAMVRKDSVQHVVSDAGAR